MISNLVWRTCFWNSIQQVRWLSHSTDTVTVSFNRYGDCLIQQIRWLSHSTNTVTVSFNRWLSQFTKCYGIRKHKTVIWCGLNNTHNFMYGIRKTSHLFGVSLTIHCTYKLFYKPKKYTNVNLSLKKAYFCPSFKCPLCDEPPLSNLSLLDTNYRDTMIKTHPRWIVIESNLLVIAGWSRKVIRGEIVGIND